MKYLVVILLCASVYFCAGQEAGINVDEVLKNDRLLTQYINCILDKGRCNSEGYELKNTLPKAIKDNCSTCTAKQKTDGQKVIKFLYNNRKSDWDAIIAKYDPTGIYKSNYEQYY